MNDPEEKALLSQASVHVTFDIVTRLRFPYAVESSMQACRQRQAENLSTESLHDWQVTTAAIFSVF